MGKGVLEVFFKTGVPSFPKIQAAFLEQTGLKIQLTAALHITSPCTSSAEIPELLAQDAAAVAELLTRKERIYRENPGRYEVLAAACDDIWQQLRQFNHISAITLVIPEFYELTFECTPTTLTLDWYLNQYYGIISLEKVLLELGGQCVNLDGNRSRNYPLAWQKLKRWEDYRWYNRPRK